MAFFHMNFFSPTLLVGTDVNVFIPTPDSGELSTGQDIGYFHDGVKYPVLYLLHGAYGELSGVPCVADDNYGGGYQLARYLASRGHRHIGMLGGNWSCFQIGHSRYLGCLQACQELDLPFDGDRQCEPCRYSLEDGYAAAKVLLDRCPGLTAIFAVSDVTALGAMRALRDLGKRVPEDISVMGYDGITIGQYSLPRLTTVRQDTQQLAERGVDALLRSILRRSPSVHGLVPFHLVEGESVAQLR